jgi:hypothetical protein
MASRSAASTERCFVELECRKCGKPIADEDVHVELAVARCASCRTVMDLTSRQTVEDGDGNPGSRARLRAPVPMPARFQVSDTASGLIVTWRWFTPRLVSQALFCVIWDVLVFLGLTADHSKSQLEMMLSWLLFGGAAVWLTYTTLAGLLNRTRVEVRSGVLSIRHFPLPWPGNRDLPARDIEQLYCEERFGHSGKQTTVRYLVNAILRSDGRTVKPLGELEQAQQALFLEQLIEQRLGIADQPVGGELASRQSA